MIDGRFALVADLISEPALSTRRGEVARAILTAKRLTDLPD